MTALHETTAPLPPGVINQMTAACLPAGCLHLTAAVSEAGAFFLPWDRGVGTPPAVPLTPLLYSQGRWWWGPEA